MRRKALLVGVNYVGSSHALRGCHQDARNVLAFLLRWGFRQEDIVILTDEAWVDPRGKQYPSGLNILRAMDWLVSDAYGSSLFFHYSGHGSQCPDPDGNGLIDTICPADFERNGQINADLLHQHLVYPLPPDAGLHAIFDCCHSGSVLELPFVYRTDEDGNVNMIDNIKQGIRLASTAANIWQGTIQGGFSMDRIRDAEQLYAGARSFWKGLNHAGGNEEGLGSADDNIAAKNHGRSRPVIMYSGCRDDQTSADANIAGAATGAMSWAFLRVMAENDGNQSYVDILRNTRGLLKQNYSQVPQLSVGIREFDLRRPFRI